MSLLETVRHIAPYLERWLEYGRDYQRIPGVQVAVRVGDELAASFALGKANEDTGEALTTRHLPPSPRIPRPSRPPPSFNSSRPENCAWTIRRATGCRSWGVPPPPT
ncbi:hypothetical protein DEMA109039_20625 [Deinococcus marmoris]